MDLVNGAIVGGLIYETFQFGVKEYLMCVKVALKDYVLTDEEHNLIVQDLMLTTDEDRKSKESLEEFFENKAQNTKQIINKYKQININHKGSGDNITHTGSGDNITHTGSGNIVLEKAKKAKKY